MRKEKRLTALFAALILVFSLNVSALAEDEPDEGVQQLTVCKNHTQHDAACGYAEAVEAEACAHSCELCAAPIAMTPMSVDIGAPSNTYPVVDTTGANTVTGNQVYFGNYMDYYALPSSQVKWRVVANDGSTMTLFCDGAVARRTYDSSTHHDWSGSEICAWLNQDSGGGFLFDAFSAAERSVIPNYGTTEAGNSYGAIQNPAWVPATIDISKKIVLPSYAEIIDNGAWSMAESDRAFSSASWRLRSPGQQNYNAAFVNKNGSVDPGISADSSVTIAYGIRPAFKITLDSILLTSAAAGGKAGAVGPELSAAQQPTDAIKLTVYDTANITLTSVIPTDVSGRTITLGYTGAATGETLSAIVTNVSGAVTYYGKLAATITANDAAAVTLPNDFSATDTLQIFVEQINSDYLTDYASTPIIVTIASQAAPAAPTGGAGQITGVDNTMEYKLPAASTWTAITGTSVSGLTAGNYEVRYKNCVDNGTVYLDNAVKTLTVDDKPAAPIITSANSTSVAFGTTGSFTVTATGNAPITYSLSGAPAGVSINSATGVMSIAATTEAATHSFTITATNGVLPNATQNFTVTIIAPGTTYKEWTDSATGIIVGGMFVDTGIPANLIVERLPETDDNYKALLVDGKAVAGAYEVYFDSPYTLAPGQKLTVTFPVEASLDGQQILLRCKQPGSTVKGFTPTAQNGAVSVTVGELSPFMLLKDKAVQTPDPTPTPTPTPAPTPTPTPDPTLTPPEAAAGASGSPQTGDSGTGPWAVMAASSLCLVVGLLYWHKRRKANQKNG